MDRTPIMLRVAQGDTILQEADPPPAPHVPVYAYIMSGKPSTGFWDGRDPKTGRRTGGMFSHAQYRYLSEQPPEEALRDGAAWAAWCDANKGALMGTHERLCRETP